LKSFVIEGSTEVIALALRFRIQRSGATFARDVRAAMFATPWFCDDGYLTITPRQMTGRLQADQM
jgi:hypothetical protein